MCSLKDYALARIGYIVGQVKKLQDEVSRLEVEYVKSYCIEDKADCLKEAKGLYSEAVKLKNDLVDWLNCISGHEDDYVEVDCVLNQMSFSIENMRGVGGGSYSVAMERYLLGEEDEDD